jgi:signal transduction histidine kinase
LDIEFTAPGFSAPESIHFRHRLDGLDNDWVNAESRSASYSRLAAGDYHFRLQASLGDGPWREASVPVAMVVTPFFWQTWWFQLSLLAAFTAVVAAIVRYVSFRRLRLELLAAERQAAIERERARIARDIHDDLGNRLTTIQLLSGIAQRDGAPREQAGGHVRQISLAAWQATSALDEIVWAINPGNDTLPHLVDYLGQFTVEFLRSAGIRCIVDLPEHPPSRAVPAEFRHNLFMAVKEALNNVLKHSGATEVRLSIVATEESVTVRVEDNGRGFSDNVRTNGEDGLRNMHRRMEDIGGTFAIDSTPGAGTRINFGFTWPRTAKSEGGP